MINFFSYYIKFKKIQEKKDYFLKKVNPTYLNQMINNYNLKVIPIKMIY